MSPSPFTARRVDYRRAVSPFASAGSIDARQAKIETYDDIGSVGLVQRCLALEQQGARVGIDIDASPEDAAWQIQMSNAW